MTENGKIQILMLININDVREIFDAIEEIIACFDETNYKIYLLKKLPTN